MYKKKRRLKKEVIIGAVILLAVIIIGILAFNYFSYHSSYTYKLKEVGYQDDEVETILNNLEDTQIDDILKKEYNRNIPKLIIQKYFIYKNLDRYSKYMDENTDESPKNVVAIVNVNGDYDYYTHTKKTDMSKKNLILTNKYNYLDKTYTPDDLVKISNRYAYEDNHVREEVNDQYVSVWNAANEEGLVLIANSSFRSYESQDAVWKRYKNQRGEEYADEYAARAGYSEHQTGLCIDIVSDGAIANDFEETEEFKWLQKNAYKYGFILRYPKGKEKITGYSYESWHYRYVGVEAAKEIHDANITFDEYYAYYLAK